MELEKDIEAYLVRKVRAEGGVCLKFVSPGAKGVPDRICLFPEGVIVFVELKRDGGLVSKLQQHWERVIIERGGHHRYIWCRADADDLIRWYRKRYHHRRE